MIRYNDDDIYVGYIKQLLHTFNLPTCKIGFPEGFENNKVDFHYIKGNSLYLYHAPVEDGPAGYSERVDAYKFNDRLLNITKHLEIRSNIYDSYTHEYLGEYLRYIRDYAGLDLMSMYNCFSNNSVVRMNLTVNGSVFNSSDESCAIFAIPVKFNKKYTVAIDWHGSLEMFCGYYSNGNVLSSAMLQNNTYLKVEDTRFNHPFLYTKLVDIFNGGDTSYLDITKENCLKLFIKVPVSCKSSIVVLEGDYIKNTEIAFSDSMKVPQVLNAEMMFYKPEVIVDEEQGTTEVLDEIYCSGVPADRFVYNYLSKPQLLYMNSQRHYLLADRLIEYLSNNAVNPLDDVVTNIKHLQDKIFYDSKLFNPSEVISYYARDYGIWDEDLRKYLYRFADRYKYNSRYFDILGYLDKDIEERIANYDDLLKAPEGRNNKWQLED